MRGKIYYGVLAILAVAFLGGLSPLWAQRPMADAVAGEPFGVGRIVVNLPEEMLPQSLGAEGLAIADPSGRVMYPAVNSPGFGKIVKEVLDADTPLTTGGPVREQVGGILRGIVNRQPPTTIYFLFRGTEPLNITLHARNPIPITLYPRPAPGAHLRLLDLWWREYARQPGLLQQKPDYPPLVENYLTTMLARRLNLQLPRGMDNSSPYDDLEREIGLTLGTEKFRVALQRARMLGEYPGDQPADRPLPPPMDVPPLAFADNKPLAPGDSPGAKPEQSPIEPLAMRVPEECFYIRFGSFANFLWIQDTLERWGGDAKNLIALRGLDLDSRGRIERQLILKQTALSRMFGPTVVADVAIIGTDLFFREGASYGFLFQAKNNFLFGNNIKTERQARLKAGGVEEKTVKIAGKQVSYIFSADGTVRSYYAVDGDFHFFTTSRRLVERFFETGKGTGSLGKSEEYRNARQMMPLSREDTIFVYFSDAFFRNITSPHYRVEMARRLQAMADVELVQLAKLAAAAEGQPGKTIEDLQRGGFLPERFGPLPDGSRIILAGGEVLDDHRGRRGGFLPIPDMPVGNITAFELAEYQRFADFYSRQWGRIDPIMVGVKRTDLPSPPAPLPKGEGEKREQVVADVLMTPFAPQHFDLLRRYAGLPDAQRIAPVPGDLAAFDFVMPAQHIFGGLRDFGPPPQQQFGRLLPLGRLREWLVGYIGTSGDLGPLRILNLGFSSPDAYGYAFAILTGGWRRQFGPFTVFSFQHELLDEVTPQIRFEPDERPAQLRLHIDDPTSARIMPMANNWAYRRTCETSLNNLRLMNDLEQQLHVPPASCKEAAEFLLDAKLICPLGGKYVLQQAGPDFARWTSTALENQSASRSSLFSAAPPGYVAPPWNWFRGMKLDALMTQKDISAHAEVIMQLPEKK